MRNLVKTVCFFCSLVFICSCHNNTGSAQAAETQTATVKTDTAKFLSLFKELHFDSLLIYSVFDSMHEGNLMTGVFIDTIYRPLMPDTFQRWGLRLNTDTMYASFAIGRFDLGDDLEALIIRYPGKYYSSRISMMVFDKKRNQFVNKFLSLSEDFGDAGLQDVWRSLLIRSGSKLYIKQSGHSSRQLETDTTFETFVRTYTTTDFFMEHGQVSPRVNKIISRDTFKL